MWKNVFKLYFGSDSIYIIQRLSLKSCFEECVFNYASGVTYRGVKGALETGLQTELLSVIHCY